MTAAIKSHLAESSRSSQILLIDDSEDVHRMVAALMGRDHAVTWSKSLSEAKLELAARGHEYDLVLLDVDLPDGDGVEALSRGELGGEAVGQKTILLTAFNSVDTRVKGFTSGAVDFIAKPFDPREFQVRIASRLKFGRATSLAAQAAPQTQILRLRNLEIDLDRQRAYEVKGTERFELEFTPVEFRLLLLFTRERIKADLHQALRAAVSRELILKEVWGDRTHVSARCVDHHVCAVRRKIAALGARVESVYGVGYRLEFD